MANMAAPPMATQDDFNEDVRAAIVEVSNEIVDLEYAHAALALRAAKAIADVLGWREVDIRSFLRQHMQDIRVFRYRPDPKHDNRLLLRLDQMAATLDATRLPLPESPD